MFKEVLFELSGGQPRSKHSGYFFDHPEVAAQMRILHATPEHVWEIIDVSGEPDAIDAFRAFLEEDQEASMESLELVSAATRHVRYVIKWARPRPDEPALSIEFLVTDVVGPDAIFHMRVDGRRAEVKVAGPDGSRLLRFFNEVQQRLQSRFQVRLLRMGEHRADWEAPKSQASDLRDEDRQLLAYALAAGYYDNPKKVGVRELGDALGCSKSVIARKLRTIERRALESLVGRADGVPVMLQRPAAEPVAVAPREEPQLELMPVT